MFYESLNIIAYCIYLPITFFITIQVGWICYKNGVVYLKGILKGDHQWLEIVNKLLLIGYYLVNLGYAAITLSYWNHIATVNELIGELASRIGFITITLGIMHGVNLWLATFLPKILNHQ
ncbi:MAG: hypothetical protein ACPGJS_01535 [Flammeovirgaceae bacterium]